MCVVGGGGEMMNWSVKQTTVTATKYHENMYTPLNPNVI